jgi:cell division transport system permease protein
MIEWLQPRAQRYRFLPYAQSRSALPWIIGMMTFLAALAIAAAAALSFATSALGGNIGRDFTVQIVEPDPVALDRQTRAAVALLRARSDVESIRRFSRPALEALLEPWLGVGNVGEDVTLPAMIDAAFIAGTPPDVDGLRAALVGVAPGARLDTHAQWFAPLAGAANVLKWLVAAVALVVAAATITIVSLSVRASLGSHSQTIETVHILGAEDLTIAHLYQYRYGKAGMFGSLVGLVAAGACIIAISGLLAGFDGGILAEARLGAVGWLLLGLLPAVVTLLCACVARFTVLRALGAML